MHSGSFLVALGLVLLAVFLLRPIPPSYDSEAISTSEIDQTEHSDPDTPILTNEGLMNSGWARVPLFQLSNHFIQAPKERTKKWEHYTFLQGDHAGALTITDLGLVAFANVEVYNLLEKRVLFSVNEAAPLSRIPFSNQFSSGLLFEKGENFFQIDRQEGKTTVSFCLRSSTSEQVTGVMRFTNGGDEALAIVTPFEDPNLFFYEYKDPSLVLVSGSITSATGHSLHFGKGHGVLDWGRGAWPSSNHWLWAAGAGHSDRGRGLSFNFGAGFGDERAQRATENGLIVGNKVQKLGRLRWVFDPSNHSAPWHFSSPRVQLTFTPVYVFRSEVRVSEVLPFLRQLVEAGYSSTEILSVLSIQATLNKAFGRYDGTVLLEREDGRLEEAVVSNLFGFAEQMFQEW